MRLSLFCLATALAMIGGCSKTNSMVPLSEVKRRVAETQTANGKTKSRKRKT